jgi:hypothetical protein
MEYIIALFKSIEPSQFCERPKVLENEQSTAVNFDFFLHHLIIDK